MAQVAEGLHAAHRIGLVHRDVKPGNVVVERAEDGSLHPYVMDFGLAREAAAEGLTVSGSIVGTPWYMSPEQALGRIHLLDRRSDVFSAGATLYELFAGRPPFEGQSPMDVLRRILEEEAVPLRQRVPGFPADLETIVLKCLEKEPSRRYDSARALAEDLGRFLDGEPIAARPLSLTGRVVRRARKNVALTAAVAAIVLLVVASTALAVRNAWVTRRQTELAQSLGQEVKEIEVLLRFASYMLPLHDVSREKAVVRGRLAELETRVSRLGPAGEGPGRYALGRGYLTLGEPEKAHEHLLAAWEAGYRNADVHYALGLSLARLYEKGLRNLTSSPTTEEKTRRRKDLEEMLRKPALEHLREARGVKIDAKEVVTSLVADLEGDYSRAVDEAKRAGDRVPWLYEARALEARALRRRADAARDKGNDEAALADYQRAEEALLAAVEVGRSYPEAYQSLCTLYSEMMELDWKRKLPPVEKFRLAAGWCQKAVACDPGGILSLLRLSDVYWRWAEYQTSVGEDPRPVLDKSITTAEKTIRSGFDLAYTYDNLGIAWQQRGDWEQRHGIDPTSSHQRSVESYDVVLEKYPMLFSTYCNATTVRVSRAGWEVDSGRDPSPILARAREIVAKGRTVTSHFCIPSAAAAVEYETLRWTVASGRDVTTAEAGVRAAVSELRAANATLLEAELLDARAHLLLAREAVRRGEDPRDALKVVEAVVRRAEELNAQAKEVPLYLAEASLLRAASAKGAARWEEIEALLLEARKRDPLGTEPLAATARFLLARGKARGGLSASDAKRGLEAADAALAVNRGLAEVWVARGAFLDALGRRSEASEARRNGVERNPFVLRLWPELA
jgi:serine/threonine-protein kinase